MSDAAYSACKFRSILELEDRNIIGFIEVSFPSREMSRIEN